MFSTDAETASRESESLEDKNRREADPTDLFGFVLESMVVPFLDSKRNQKIQEYLTKDVRVFSRTSRPRSGEPTGTKSAVQEEYVRSSLSRIAITFDGGNPQTTAMILPTGQPTALTTRLTGDRGPDSAIIVVGKIGATALRQECDNSQLKDTKDAMKTTEGLLSDRVEAAITLANEQQFAVDLGIKKEAVRQVKAFETELVDGGQQLQMDTSQQIYSVFDIEPLHDQLQTLLMYLHEEVQLVLVNANVAADEWRAAPVVEPDAKRQKLWHCANPLCGNSGFDDDTGDWTSCSVKSCKAYNSWFCPSCKDVLYQHDKPIPYILQ